MSTNWNKIWDTVDESKSVGDIEKCLKANGVEQNRVLPLIRSAVRSYARSREYHAERQSSMTALKHENAALKAQLSKK